MALMLRRARRAMMLGLLALPALPQPGLAQTSPAQPQLFFDDFAQPSPAQLTQQGWTIRHTAGHPGVAGARWSADAVSLITDASTRSTWLRLRASTDGTAGGTEHAQLCGPRQFLKGTHSARVRLSDQAASGPSADQIVQSFYLISPLRFDFDPDFSEIDWEYLPNGGWGDTQPRLYAVNWQTVRINPWQAHNQYQQLMGRHGGWRQLTMHVDEHNTRWYLDETLVAVHGGRQQPVQTMGLNLSVWFADLATTTPGERRHWHVDVDWVASFGGQLLSPQAVQQQITRWQADGVRRLNSFDSSQAQPAVCDL